MSVTKIDEYSARDTIEVLRDLLARAETGHVKGFAFSFKSSSSRHRFGFTGDYSKNPFEALACAARMEYRLNQLLSSRNGDPATQTMPL